MPASILDDTFIIHNVASATAAAAAAAAATVGSNVTPGSTSTGAPTASELQLGMHDQIPTASIKMESSSTALASAAASAVAAANSPYYCNSYPGGTGAAAAVSAGTTTDSRVPANPMIASSGYSKCFLVMFEMVDIWTFGFS